MIEKMTELCLKNTIPSFFYKFRVDVLGGMSYTYLVRRFLNKFHVSIGNLRRE